MMNYSNQDDNYLDRYDDSDRINITRQLIPGTFECSPSTYSLIIHYTIQVDVLDPSYNLIASRQREKQVQIKFNGLTETSDSEEIADSLIGQSDLLPEEKRDDLISALDKLKSLLIRPSAYDSSPISKPTKETKKEPANQIALTMSKAEIDDMLNDAIQHIHWGDLPECLHTLNELVEISKFDQNLQLIIQHSALMNTLVNGLRKYATTSLPACISIITIFEKMSSFSNYQELLSNFKIGIMSFGLLTAQIHLTKIASEKMRKEEFNDYLHSQNTLLRLTISLLFNLGDNPTTLRKMVEKGLVDPLNIVLKRKDPELLTISLRFIRKIASVNVMWSDIPFDSIIPQIAKYVLRWHPSDAASPAQKRLVIGVLREAIDLLYTFSFHEAVLPYFKESGVFEALSKFSDSSELRSSIVRLIYMYSKSGGDYTVFRSPTLLQMLIKAASPGGSKGEEPMIALVVLTKLSSDRECAEVIAKSPTFTAENVKAMFVQATSTTGKKTQESSILLKMIRNVADSQPGLVHGFDQEIIDACQQNENNIEVLSEIFAISSRATMTKERANFFSTQKPFVALIFKLLKGKNTSPQLLLECVMFVGSVMLFSAPAKIFAHYKIVEPVVKVYTSHPDDLDIQAQCMYAFYRFIVHKETRAALLEHNEVIGSVIQHSASRNPVISKIANSVVELAITFDESIVAQIKEPRFMSFNNEWLASMSKIKNQVSKP